MPLERLQYSCTLPAEYLTARSRLCRVANMPLKHADMSVCTSTFQYYFALQSLHRSFPVPLCTTKLAQILSSTTFFYKACTKTCTKYVPALLCTTKLQYCLVLQSLHKSTFQYYFVLQSLHKVRSSTTLYYKTCTKDVPVLLCTTKPAQNTSQYYFVVVVNESALP